ncbi:MAG: hypothetical protein IKV61_05315 [Clostridia bacterium]|nr:hypothetical protein [Clostridia bacterium]
MVTNDYGKLAYLKIAELENKIQILEGKVNQNSYTELEFLYSNLTNKYTHEFSVTLNSLKDGASTIKIMLDATLQSGNALLEVKVNNVTLYKESNFKNAQNSYSFEANLSKGKNLISFKVEDLTTQFALNNLKITVGGFVEYLKTKNYVSNVTVNDVEYVLHLNNDTGVLFTYSYQTGLVNSYAIPNVIDCKIAGVINNVLYILYISKENNLFACAYNLETSEDNVVNLNVNSCTSVAGYPVDGAIKVFYSKFAKIYSGIYEFGKAFMPTFTGRKGLEIYADANSPSAIVIVDNFLNAKFITD